MENIKNIDSFFTELKNHREKQSIKLEEISDFTKINIKYLEAIENGDFNILPVVYMRLFLRSYSNYIGTDSKKALKDFESYSNFSARNDFTIDTSDGPKMINTEKSRSFKTDEKYYLSPKNIISILFSILALIFFFLFAKQISEKKSTDNSTILDKQNSDSTTVNSQINELQESQ